MPLHSGVSLYLEDLGKIQNAINIGNDLVHVHG